MKMKIICTVLLVFTFCFELYAQTNFQLSSLKKDSPKSEGNENATRLTLGLGAVTPLGSGIYRPMLTLNSNIHIFRILYINLGFDFYSEPKYSQAVVFAPNIAVNIGINFLKDKFTFFGGGGLYIYYFQLIGILFFARCEFNLEKSFSVGLEMKHPNFGRQEFNGQPLVLSNLYLAIKF